MTFAIGQSYLVDSGGAFPAWPYPHSLSHGYDQNFTLGPEAFIFLTLSFPVYEHDANLISTDLQLSDIHYVGGTVLLTVGVLLRLSQQTEIPTKAS